MTRFKPRRKSIERRLAAIEPLEQRVVLSAAGPMQVLATVPFASGVELTLNQPPDLELLNLYAGLGGRGSAADVELLGQTSGPVAGSLHWSSEEELLRFVGTLGPLAPDHYELRIPSRADGLVAADGGIAIDGDGDGTAGDDYRFEFDVAVEQPRTVSLDRFVRGPAQPAALNGALGIPLSIDNSQDLTRLELTVRFDPSLVNLTGASPAANLPGDWSVESFDVVVPGEVQLVAAGSTPLDEGARDLLVVDAFMRFDAPYRAEGIVTVENVVLNEGALTGRGDHSLHVVAYLGDVTGQDQYSSLDAAMIARVAVGIDSGFESFNRIDPVLLGDASGSGELSALDAAIVARTSVRLPQPEIPTTDNHVSARGNRYEMAADELFAANLIFDDTGEGLDAGVAANDPLRIVELGDQPVAGITVIRTELGTELVVSPDGSIGLSDAQIADLARMNEGESLSDSFTYTVESATGLTGTATVELLVTASPFFEFQVELVARVAPTDTSEFTVFVAQPRTNSDTGVGRLELTTDANGTRLDYELTRLLDFDFDGMKTPGDLTDDILSMSFRDERTDVFAIPFDDENGTGEVFGSWTAADGFDAATMEALVAGRLTVNIRYDATLPKDVTLAGTEFYPSAELNDLPPSIEQVTVGDSYYVEVWVRDNDADSLGISVSQWTTSFDSQLTRSEPDAHLDGAFPAFNSATSDASSFTLVGASLFRGVGVCSHYARLGYALVEASAAGTQHFDLSTLEMSQIYRIGEGDPSDPADILFTGVDVRHEAAG